MNVKRESGVVETLGHSNAPNGVQDDLTPEFRVIIVQQKRRGVRLEKLYWRLLGEIAERRGLKRSRLVASIIERQEQTSKNIASALRGFIARTLDEERDANTLRSSEGFLMRLLQQAPVPAFAIDRKKRVHQANQEFIQILRVMVGNMAGKVSADVVKLTLDKPIEELFIQLTVNTSTHCHYVIQLDGKQKRGRVKIVAVPTSPHAMLIGYVVS